MRWIRAACYRAAKGAMVRIARERAKRFDSSGDGLLPTVQLESLNAVWEDAWRQVSYYAALKEKYNLPDRFGSLTEFSARMPILRKQDLQMNRELFRRATGPPDTYLATGGSTGEPVRVGIWKSEGTVSGANHLIGRSWYGVVPGDKLFLVWGHSHLLGSGWRYYLRGVTRCLKDRFLGYYRANAYFLDDASLAKMAEACLRYRPDFIVGYSGALVLLARHVKGKARFRPKVVIGCAEGFQDQQSRKRVSEAFQGPVSMEYGSVECGCIAHEHPEGGYRVFWDTHLVETEPGDWDAAPLLVTKLTRCYTPLIRYRICDSVDLEERTVGPLEHFAHVSGRTNDYIDLPDGARIHSEVIAHAIRDIPSVMQFQLVRESEIPTAIRVRMEDRLDAATEEAIRTRLARINSKLATLGIVPVNDMPKTAAGKVRWYVDESGPLERFSKVTGRTDDITFLPSGRKIHWAVIDDALCELRSVLQFQFVRQRGRPVGIRVRTEGKMTADLEMEIRNRLSRVYAELADLPIVQVDDMPKTPAGKVRWYVDE